MKIIFVLIWIKIRKNNLFVDKSKICHFILCISINENEII